MAVNKYKILSWAVALMFIDFAAVNLNDPDGWIWALIYVAVAVLTLSQKVNQKYLNQLALVLLVLGSLIASGILNPWMPQQENGRMVNMWEHQREGLGIILGSAWLWLGRKLK